MRVLPALLWLDPREELIFQCVVTVVFCLPAFSWKEVTEHTTPQLSANKIFWA